MSLKVDDLLEYAQGLRTGETVLDGAKERVERAFTISSRQLRDALEEKRLDDPKGKNFQDVAHWTGLLLNSMRHCVHELFSEEIEVLKGRLDDTGSHLHNIAFVVKKEFEDMEYASQDRVRQQRRSVVQDLETQVELQRHAHHTNARRMVMLENEKLRAQFEWQMGEVEKRYEEQIEALQIQVEMLRREKSLAVQEGVQQVAAIQVERNNLVHAHRTEKTLLKQDAQDREGKLLTEQEEREEVHRKQVEQAAAHRARVIESMVRRIQMRPMAMAFTKWREGVDARRQIAAAKAEVARAESQSDVVRAEAAKRMEEVMAEKERVIHEAKVEAERVKSEAHLAEQEFLENTSRLEQSRLRMALAHMSAGSVRQRWVMWRAYTMNCRELKMKVATALGFSTLTTLRGAFEGFRMRVIGRRFLRKAEARRERERVEFDRWMTYRDGLIRDAFGAWSDQLSDMRGERMAERHETKKLLRYAFDQFKALHPNYHESAEERKARVSLAVKMQSTAALGEDTVLEVKAVLQAVGGYVKPDEAYLEEGFAAFMYAVEMKKKLSRAIACFVGNKMRLAFDVLRATVTRAKLVEDSAVRHMALLCMRLGSKVLGAWAHVAVREKIRRLQSERVTLSEKVEEIQADMTEMAEEAKGEVGALAAVGGTRAAIRQIESLKEAVRFLRAQEVEMKARLECMQAEHSEALSRLQHKVAGEQSKRRGDIAGLAAERDRLAAEEAYLNEREVALREREEMAAAREVQCGAAEAEAARVESEAREETRQEQQRRWKLLYSMLDLMSEDKTMAKSTRAKLDSLLASEAWGEEEEGEACRLLEEEVARIQDCAHKGLRSGMYLQAQSRKEMQTIRRELAVHRRSLLEYCLEQLKSARDRDALFRAGDLFVAEQGDGGYEALQSMRGRLGMHEIISVINEVAAPETLARTLENIRRVEAELHRQDTTFRYEAAVGADGATAGLTSPRTSFRG
eukprot:CAMPEP_0182891652 /NCGR_PEP_ID=MMETSP0034_2-20130328/23381_1 /TAXON_ID=156128 /ORGANISM="Nephroselmis pyriformis, Strain CCMP717" /LENGTH=969 /DNA_ID=CAMNT_0025025273 /DNA_START=156 /DNA_END=3061 /DNA_ORIENTATION=+